MTDPERKRVGNAGAAALLGVKAVTWRKSVSEGYAPPPDGRETFGGSPWWFEDTVTAYRDSRPGRGHRSDLEAKRPAEVA